MMPGDSRSFGVAPTKYKVPFLFCFSLCCNSAAKNGAMLSVKNMSDSLQASGVISPASAAAAIKTHRKEARERAVDGSHGRQEAE